MLSRLLPVYVLLFLSPGAYADADPGRAAARTHDYAKAAIIWQSQAKAGSALASYKLSLLYGSGLALPRDGGQAFQLMHDAATQGFAPAQYALADMYKAGRHTEPDEAQAWRWLVESAAAGYAPAQNTLAASQASAESPDDKQRASLLQQAAQQGYPPAQIRLAYHYLKGYGVPQDIARARYWLQQAAARGEADASMILAKDPKFMASQFGFFKRATTDNFGGSDGPSAGIGDSQEPPELWCEHSAGAAFVLEQDVVDGYRPRIKRPDALNWCRKTAAQGFAPSLFQLGHLGYSGRTGKTVDLVLTYAYYSLAAKNGEAEAARARDKWIAVKLNREQLAEAHVLTSGWKSGQLLPDISKTGVFSLDDPYVMLGNLLANVFAGERPAGAAVKDIFSSRARCIERQQTRNALLIGILRSELDVKTATPLEWIFSEKSGYRVLQTVVWKEKTSGVLTQQEYSDLMETAVNVSGLQEASVRFEQVIPKIWRTYSDQLEKKSDEPANAVCLQAAVRSN